MSKTYMCSANSISNQKFLSIMTSYVFDGFDGDIKMGVSCNVRDTFALVFY